MVKEEENIDLKLDPSISIDLKLDPSISYNAWKEPKVLWTVVIPKDGMFHISYTVELSVWQRFWFKFIGWGVNKGDV